jgi:DNA-binding response OmpR family regulator
MAEARVLFVEDEEFQREAIRDYLTGRGLSVKAVKDAKEFRDAAKQEMPDIALLDVRLGDGENGESLARWLRDQSAGVGIILLTGAGEMVDRIVSLEVGADDYLSKPVEPRELLARINAVLRRGVGSGATGEAKTSGRIQVGATLFDPALRLLVCEDGRQVQLGQGEFELLRVLVAHPNRVLEREWLLETTTPGNEESDAFDRAIDLRIMRLRRKVERDPARPEAIRTVRGAGYMFVP